MLRRVLVAICLSALGAGCTPVDGTHLVDAEDLPAFSAWQRRVGSELPAAVQKDFLEALQEIRYRITAKAEASGHDPIEAALCKYIHGKSVNDVILLGDRFEWERLTGEQAKLEKAIAANALLITKPNDLGAANDLADYRAKEQKQMDGIVAELERLEQSMVALGGKVPQRTSGSLEPSPPLSRPDALREIAGLLEGRRTVGTIKYGDHPVRIDREGSGLDEKNARSFHDRKNAALAAGRVLIPAHIMGRWLIYEGPYQAPALPDRVIANLTAEERQKFTDDWVNLEAELWAREVASNIDALK